MNYENNKINLTLEYVLQPTDKGDKVLAQIKNSSDMQTLVSDTLTYAFLKPQIEKNQVQNLETTKANMRRNNTDYLANEAALEAAEAANAAADEVLAESYEEY